MARIGIKKTKKINEFTIRVDANFNISNISMYLEFYIALLGLVYIVSRDSSEKSLD